ncbi:MAG: ATP-dependent helicase [Firmicutes bacterium]|nr:ATP-dependent helicase [Bacillota bacterium]
MENTFDKLGLSEELVNGLKLMGIKDPTEIQQKAIPWAIANRDVIGQSQTGSGKTLAYLLPLFMKIASDKREMQAIILAPTHELAMQIDMTVRLLSEKSGIPVTSAAIIGDVNVKRQIEKLREKPHIIVGSAGRIIELIKMKKINAQTVKTIVLDEGDKLLNDKNIKVVKDIIKTTMKDRQLMVFSATVSEKAISVAKDLMKTPEIIKIKEENMVNPDIEHLYLQCEQRDKMEMLRKLIAATEPSKAIIFINKSDDIQITTSKLKFHNINAYSIFGTAAKEDRKNAMEGFRSGKYRLLVASDLAARGLDIAGVSLIFNLDIPEDHKEYLHRAGRTGRQGMEGTCISIVTEKEVATLKKMEREFNIEISPAKIYKGIISKISE